MTQAPDLPGLAQSPSKPASARDVQRCKASLSQPGHSPRSQVAGSFSAKEVIGQNIRKHRKRCGMTLQALGDEVGVLYSRISHFESGKHLTIERIIQLSAIFGIPPAELLEGVSWECAG